MMIAYNEIIDVMILSAGSGTRVKEKFPNMPKALIPHKESIALDLVLNPIIKSSYKKFNIHLNIRLDEEKFFNDSKYNLCIENTPIGNAGAIKYFGERLSDPFIVMHNDIYLPDLNLLALHSFHSNSNSFLTMVVNNTGSNKERGIIIKKNDKVLGFTRNRFVNCGVYCVNHSAFGYINDGFQDIDENLLPNLISIHQLTCYEYSGHYEDWGR